MAGTLVIAEEGSFEGNVLGTFDHVLVKPGALRPTVSVHRRLILAEEGTVLHIPEGWNLVEIRAGHAIPLLVDVPDSRLSRSIV